VLQLKWRYLISFNTEKIIKYLVLSHLLLGVRPVVYLISATIILIHCITPVTGQMPQDDFVTFGKSIFGVSIKHPQDWAVNDYDRSVKDDRIGYDLVASMCPKSINYHKILLWKNYLIIWMSAENLRLQDTRQETP